MNELKLNKKLIFQIVLIALFIVGCIIATIYLYPIITRINTDEVYKEEFIKTINGFGIWGILVVLACFILQNILAVIPTAPFELVAGMLYGTVGGLVVASIGSTLGALAVILLVKLFGENFAKAFVNMEDKKKFRFVDDPKRTSVIMFCILFMPGVPKDFLSFLVPFTKVKIRTFLIINIVARIPSVIITASLGNSLINGKVSVSLVLFILSIIIALLGIVFNKQIVNLINKFGKKKEEE